MDIAVERGALLGPLKPSLDVWTQRTVMVGGSPTAVSALQAPTALTWEVFDISTPQLEDAPASIGTGTVNVSTDKVDGQVGHYAATWTVPSTVNGRCVIVWSCNLDGLKTFSMRREFDILPRVGGPVTGYSLVSDLREQGLGDSVSNARALRLIAAASRYFERCTGRFFEPRLRNLQLDGTGGRAVQFDDPLIALASVSLGDPPLYPVGMEGLRLYNRHITQGLTSPDDRDDPKIEFVHFRDVYGRQRSPGVGSPMFGVPFRDLYFPQGVLNVNVVGLFGFTDPDGSSQGMTPDLVRQAITRIAWRDAPTLGDPDREDVRDRHYLTSERTRDQSYTRETASEGAFTGDRSIDDVIRMYMRPLGLGSA